jgi:hypothetical protein
MSEELIVGPKGPKHGVTDAASWAILARVWVAEEEYRKAQIAEWRARDTARHAEAKAQLDRTWATLRFLDGIPKRFPTGEPCTIYENKLVDRGIRRLRQQTKLKRLQAKYDNVSQH